MRFLRPLGWANLVVNILIVVTGGAVRLTGSGLGCPTWPRCTRGAFTPHGALGIHRAIEFGNRTLTFLLLVVAVAVLVATWKARPDLRKVAGAVLVGVFLQAGVGGITVLTGLNPWIVGVHLVISMAMVSLTVLYVWRLEHTAPARAGGPAPLVALLAWLTAWLVLVAGTVVTGAGPHAGDRKTPRNGLDTLEASQFHADLVFLLIGLSVALLVLTRSRVAAVLVAVELAQGLIGYVQYFTDLPVVLVACHMLGAAVLAAVATWALLDTRES